MLSPYIPNRPSVFRTPYGKVNYSGIPFGLRIVSALSNLVGNKKVQTNRGILLFANLLISENLLMTSTANKQSSTSTLSFSLTS